MAAVISIRLEVSAAETAASSANRNHIQFYLCKFLFIDLLIIIYHHQASVKKYRLCSLCASQIAAAAGEYLTIFNNENGRYNYRHYAQAFMSLFCDDCITRDIDISCGGARYSSVHGAVGIMCLLPIGLPLLKE